MCWLGWEWEWEVSGFPLRFGFLRGGFCLWNLEEAWADFNIFGEQSVESQ